MAPKKRDPITRLTEKIAVDEGGCWIYQGALFPATGYGAFWFDGKQTLAHRTAYELLVGPVPSGMHLDHLCRVRECCNPAHLDPVTPSENLHRSPVTLATVNAAKTHCPQNHPYDEANTYRAPSSPNTRQCRTCLRDRARAAA